MHNLTKVLRYTLLTIASLLVLAACQTTQQPTEKPLAIVDLTIGENGQTTLETAALQNSALYNGINFKIVSVTNGGATAGLSGGRVQTTLVQIQNIGKTTFNNLTFLGLSTKTNEFYKGEMHTSAFKEIIDEGNKVIADAKVYGLVKPVHETGFSGTKETFVAYDENSIKTVQSTIKAGFPKIDVTTVFPWGFQMDKPIAPGETGLVRVSFWIPDFNTSKGIPAIKSFTVRLALMDDNQTRFTQDFIETNKNDYQSVRSRYGASSQSNKTLVLIGPAKRTVAKTDIDNNIFTLLPNIRIAGTADAPTAMLLDTTDKALPTLEPAP